MIFVITTTLFVNTYNVIKEEILMNKKLYIGALSAFGLALLTGCGGNQQQAGTPTPTPAPGATPAPGDDTAGDQITLNILGPGLFSEVTRTGALDLVTGVQRPGYEEVIARWNELHPNVELNINALPWDNWQASLQTAALAGDVDVLVHAASIPDIVEPLNRFVDASGVSDSIAQLALRRLTTEGDFQELTPLGMSINVNPVVVVLDTYILADFGVPIPTVNWTLADMLAIAEATTGINPRTGVQNYGISMLPNNNVQQNFIWAARAMDATSIEFGPSLLESDINFDNSAVQEVLNFINSLHNFSSPDYIEGFDLLETVTENSNLAMYLNQSAFVEYNRLVAAGLAERFMFLPLPDIQGGVNSGRTSSHMGDWNMTIARTSPNQDWAWEFIYFMVTDPVVQDWLVRVHQIPNSLVGLESVVTNMSPQYFAAIEHILINQAENFSVQTSEWYDSTTIPVIPSAVQLALNEMFRGTMDASQASAFIQERVDEFLDAMR